ncbi:ceramide kinase-like protein isoform X7 [Chiloscyllium plagiosum]|uniref:ceramide kinase-like protein isoform X7 n=1 Tax=Chiloscyllium plagiosum TaxID=36176 RepID=UPI001CB82C05|nr:ceramide kinase-like protein isoform X7 [Chiloscyllium plagiosum]
MSAGGRQTVAPLGTCETGGSGRVRSAPSPERGAEVRGPEDPICRGIFQVEKRSCDVVLTSSRLTWTPIEPESPTGSATHRGIGRTLMMTRGTEQDKRLNCDGEDDDKVVSQHKMEFVELKEVFGVKMKRRRSARQQKGGTLLGIAIFVCIKKGQNKLKNRAIHLSNLSEDYCNVWFKYMKDILNEHFPNRPKYLKVVINPYSHRMEAKQVYYEQVAPLFKLADIKTDISSSTNILAFSVHGIKHPGTAAMHIIMGNFQKVDVCTFCSHNRLLQFGFTAMLGFGGRTLALAEKHRWMPSTQRREFAVIKTLTNLKPENCELSFLPSENVYVVDQEDKRNEDEMNAIEQCNNEDKWQTIQGHFLNISIMAIPCVCSMAPRGLAPNTRLDNGSMSLIVVQNCSRADFIKHLKRYGNLTNQFDFPFVQTYTVQEVKIRTGTKHRWTDTTSDKNADFHSSHSSVISLKENSPWNVDGNLLEGTSEINIKIHSQLITLYGRNIEECDDTVKCSCL